MTVDGRAVAPIGLMLALELLDKHQSVNGVCGTCGTKYPCNAYGVRLAKSWLDEVEREIHASAQPYEKAVGVCAVSTILDAPGDGSGGRCDNGAVAPAPQRDVIGWFVSDESRQKLVSKYGSLSREGQ